MVYLVSHKAEDVYDMKYLPTLTNHQVHKLLKYNNIDNIAQNR